MGNTADLAPAAREMIRLLGAVRDEQLAAPTPCPAYSLGDLLAHIDGLSQAFTWAAAKDVDRLTGAPSGDASQLPSDWRARIPDQLEALIDAWRDEQAWTGMTRAGGLDLPGEIAGLVAMDELVVHGWDVSRAIGQPYNADEQALQACLPFLSQLPPGGNSAFGAAVDVPDDTPLLDRVIARSGRSPAWSLPV